MFYLCFIYGENHLYGASSVSGNCGNRYYSILESLTSLPTTSEVTRSSYHSMMGLFTSQPTTPQVFRVTVETGIIQCSSALLHFKIFWTKALTVAGNSKSCLKSGFMGSCVAGCPEFGTSQGAPGPSRIREADPRGRGMRSSKVK